MTLTRRGFLRKAVETVAVVTAGPALARFIPEAPLAVATSAGSDMASVGSGIELIEYPLFDTWMAGVGVSSLTTITPLFGGNDECLYHPLDSVPVHPAPGSMLCSNRNIGPLGGLQRKLRARVLPRIPPPRPLSVSSAP